MTQDNEEILLAEHRDGVLVLTLNRPERRNALSPDLYNALLARLQAAAVDKDTGAVVITGAGGAFSSGGDVKRLAGSDAEPLSVEQRIAGLRQRSRIGELLHGMDKPTIAMMRGAAVGAGLSIALACDFRYADTSARLRTGFMPLGLSGDHGGHYFMPRLVGMAKAREMYLTSPTLDAGQAHAIGLVNQVLAPELLEPHVMEVALGFAAGPRTAISYLKRNLNDGLRLTLAEVLDAEAARHVRCVDTPDHREAVRAFVEKRKPRFGL